jgi:putative transposase
VSITLETDFCLEALREAMDRHGRSEVFNTDQGAQFTSADFAGEPTARKIRIRMDGRDRYLGNIFVERLWRSLKYEGVFLKAYGTTIQELRGIGKWLEFHNDERPRQVLDYRTPSKIFEVEACVLVDNASASLGGASALPTCSLVHQQKRAAV